MGKFLYYDNIHEYAKFYVKNYNSKNKVKLSLKYLYSLNNIEEKLQIMMEDENKKRKEGCNGFSFEASSSGGKKTVELGIGIHAPISKKELARRAKKAARTLEERTGRKGDNILTWQEENPEAARAVKSNAGKIGIASTWKYYHANPDKLEERNEGIRIAANKKKDDRRVKELKTICKKIKTNDWFKQSYFNDKKINIDIRRIGILLRESDDALFEKKRNGNTFMYKLIKPK